MITCPSCNHQNPEGSMQCENCYMPLSATTSCPNCGASVQADATFCGQCGFNLQAEISPTTTVEPPPINIVEPPAEPSPITPEETIVGIPDPSPEAIVLPDEIPLSNPEPDTAPETPVHSPNLSPWDEEEEETINQSELPSGFPEVELTQTDSFTAEPAETEFAEVMSSGWDEPVQPFPEQINVESTGSVEAKALETTPEIESSSNSEPEATPETDLAAAGAMAGATQLQLQKASLLHLQSNTTIEIPHDLDVVHFGKPNGHIPPDIDVSGFANSEVVSRVHADIRIEGDVFYVEDTGSSNGTYVNHAPLQKGNRHRLRNGDRIALGKGDLVTFIFQLS